MTVPQAVSLHHYTCDHSVAGIRSSGLLRPNRATWRLEPLVWLTDLDAPDRAALGLTSYRITCDRTAYRVHVDAVDGCEPWAAYARRVHLPAEVREMYEAAEGARPAHWWVSAQPVPVAKVERWIRQGDR